MMRNSLLLGGLLLFAFFLSSRTLSGFPKKRCAPLTRASIEEKLGKPVPCLKKAEGFECFGQGQIPTVVVQFNGADQVKSLRSFDGCNGLWGINRLEEIIPQKSRGKLRQKTQPALGSCQPRYTEIYDCLTIDFWLNNCMGCAPASITITWK